MSRSGCESSSWAGALARWAGLEIGEPTARRPHSCDLLNALSSAQRTPPIFRYLQLQPHSLCQMASQPNGILPDAPSTPSRANSSGVEGSVDDLTTSNQTPTRNGTGPKVANSDSFDCFECDKCHTRPAKSNGEVDLRLLRCKSHRPPPAGPTTGAKLVGSLRLLTHKLTIFQPSLLSANVAGRCVLCRPCADGSPSACPACGDPEPASIELARHTLDECDGWDLFGPASQTSDRLQAAQAEVKKSIDKVVADLADFDEAVNNARQGLKFQRHKVSTI